MPWWLNSLASWVVVENARHPSGIQSVGDSTSGCGWGADGIVQVDAYGWLDIDVVRWSRVAAHTVPGIDAIAIAIARPARAWTAAHWTRATGRTHGSSNVAPRASATSVVSPANAGPAPQAARAVLVDAGNVAR